jgi:hypothetical protein
MNITDLISAYAAWLAVAVLVPLSLVVGWRLFKALVSW